MVLARAPIGVAALLLGLLAGPALGQTVADQDRVSRQIQSARKQVGEASAEESRLLGLIDASKRRELDIGNRVGAIDRQIGVAGRELAGAESRVAEAEAARRTTEADLAELSRALLSNRRTLMGQALSAYTGQSEATRYAGMWLSGLSATEIVPRRLYLRWAVGSQTDAIAGAERVRSEMAIRSNELVNIRAASGAQRDAVVTQRTRLAEARSAQVALRREAETELVTRDRLRDEALARKQEFQAQLRLLEQESKAIADALRLRAAAAGGPPSVQPAPGQLARPIPGAAISSAFGPRVHPIYGDVRLHAGIDFDGSTGTSIRAAAAGVVERAEILGGYGNCIIIDHGGGLATLYAHQSVMLVVAGQRVTAGQVIGRVGSTGASTGPHLHFEARLRGEPVNPAAYF